MLTGYIYPLDGQRILITYIFYKSRVTYTYFMALIKQLNDVHNVFLQQAT